MIKKIFKKLTAPKAKKEDTKRREYVLNILLLGIIVFLLVVIAIFISDMAVSGLYYQQVNLLKTLISYLAILLAFIFLFFLSRRGFILTASGILISILVIATSFLVASFGAELPTGLLGYILAIIFAGILINSGFAFLTTIISCLAILTITYLQINGHIEVNSYWKSEPLKIVDIIMFCAMFFVVAVVSWLSNRETEKSLRRARKSEAELKKERDMLEIKVEKRTAELKKAQAEKMAELSRFAEFGRISSGLFHDLVNPLTALSLNLEQINNGQDNIDNAKSYLDQSIKTTRRMGDLINAVKKQIAHQQNSTYFSLNKEIEEIIELMAYKARKANVNIIFEADENINTLGDPVKFSQVIMNIVANAIDAFDEMEKKSTNKQVLINIKKDKQNTLITIKDNGSGIKPENLPKIFEAFFTTKNFSKGSGIGLSSSKNIIEDIFAGSIQVVSEYGRGTEFIINIPLIKKDGKN